LGPHGVGKDSQVPPSPNVRIRAETADDFAEIREVVQAAFEGRVQEVELVEAVRATEGYRPELALVASRGERVIGHAMFSEVALVQVEASRTQVLDLAPVSVHPDHQRNGVGSQLVEAGLSIADAEEEPIVVVLGDLRYYGRFGFEPAERVGISPPPGVPPAVFGVRRLTRYSPDLHGSVEFPPVFTETGTL
jgi:predicted N-acetyltransferase YhbS